MLKLLRQQRGFTIIELLIVIAIIGILATLVLTNFQGAQAKGRDTVRKNDINSIYQKLEEFYNENGGYPDGELGDGVAAGINGAANDGDEVVFPGIDDGALTDADGDAISVTTEDGAALLAQPDPDTDTEYIYAGYGCDSDTPITNDTVGASCDGYVLSAFQETDTTTDYVKNSLN